MKRAKHPEPLGIKSPMPQRFKPMLCSLLKTPFNDLNYLYEVKWDGYRIVSYKDKRSVKLASRGGLDYTKKYPPITNALSKLEHNLVLDGEAVVLDQEGKPNFDDLQNFNGKKSGVYYYVFDILWWNGYDLMQEPLVKRKEILARLVKDNPVIKFSDHFGIELFKQVQALQLEGIIAKLKQSKYAPDKRAKE